MSRELIVPRLPGYLDELAALVAVPGISAEGTDSPQLLRSAEACADLLRRSQAMDDVRVLQSPGAGPAVWAERRGRSDAATVLLYAHHDVQPVGDLACWASDPWKVTERDGRLYGRGTADDKAALLVHLAALALVEPDLNVRVLLEGDEEIGSPQLAALLAEHADLLTADLVIAPDAVNHAVGVPSLTVGLRGLLDVVVEVRTLHGPIHSGIFGGAVPDATGVLLHLLASLADLDGQARIPGLLRGDLEGLALPDLATWRRQAGVLPGVTTTQDAHELLQRTAGSPSVTVVGLDLPSIAESAAVLTPAARARVLIRLAPRQDPNVALATLREHIDAQDARGATVTLTVRGANPGLGLDVHAPSTTLALQALSEGFGKAAVPMAVGGSIPFTAGYQRAFRAVPLLVTAVQDPQTNAHGYDESLDLEGFVNAIHSEALMLRALAALDPRELHPC